MMENFFAWFEISESAAYVLTTFALMVALIVAEIYGLKNRRSRAYQALLREARARRSEMHLRID